MLESLNPYHQTQVVGALSEGGLGEAQIAVLFGKTRLDRKAGETVASRHWVMVRVAAYKLAGESLEFAHAFRDKFDSDAVDKSSGLRFADSIGLAKTYSRQPADFMNELSAAMSRVDKPEVCPNCGR